MKSVISAFIGGAIVGGVTALLFAPESGEDFRKRIKKILRKNGIDFSDNEVEKLVEQITAQIKG